jgi:LmbE family N-acetylglucosaminyl deacetylase
MLEGGILIVAPHMDDETLGCGILIAESDGRQPVHVLFATDGARSPQPRAGDAAAPDLSRVRQAEAIDALAVLGVPPGNIGFLGFPDGALARHALELAALIAAQAAKLRPAHLLAPFRYDVHPDHLAVHRAASTALAHGLNGTRLLEYFVYSRWRLLPRGDVRAYVRPDDLVRLHTIDGARRKRAALACYRSQTTRFVAGQRAPILSDALLARVADEPEQFLVHDPRRPGPAALARGRRWVPLACRIEPVLKRAKDQLLGRLQ